MGANLKELNKFTEVCKKSQVSLKNYLAAFLIENGYKPINRDGFLYAKGTIPILVTAHMDTVHKMGVKQVITSVEKGKTTISSPQGIGGDDRCGIYMIMRLIEMGNTPSVLFCEDEEVGGVGSNKFCKSDYIDELKEMNYLIELDRMNSNDAVFYDCENDEFTEFITTTTGYKEAWGSFSDISHLSPACGIASVNLSCGYYNAHTVKEYVVWEDMLHTINVVDTLLKVEANQYEYIEAYTFSYGHGYFNSFCEDFYGYEYSKPKRSIGAKDDDAERNVAVYVYYVDENGDEAYDVAEGSSRMEAMGYFFMEHPYTNMSEILDYEFDWR